MTSSQASFASLRTETVAVEALRIFDAPRLDPIMVVLHDMPGHQGRLIVECYGNAWSTYWGAMGEPIRDFITGASTDYIANRLWPTKQRRTKAEYDYLTRIVQAVQTALRAQS